MEAALQEHSPSSIMERVQKIRDRMYIEQASGVPLADKAAFLVLCLQYEQRPFDERRAISSQQKKLVDTRIKGKDCKTQQRDLWHQWDKDWSEWDDTAQSDD